MPSTTYRNWLEAHANAIFGDDNHGGTVKYLSKYKGKYYAAYRYGDDEIIQIVKTTAPEEVISVTSKPKLCVLDLTREQMDTPLSESIAVSVRFYQYGKNGEEMTTHWSCRNNIMVIEFEDTIRNPDGTTRLNTWTQLQNPDAYKHSRKLILESSLPFIDKHVKVIRNWITQRRD